MGNVVAEFVAKKGGDEAEPRPRAIFDEEDSEEEEMERLSPYELELLSSSPPQTALSLSPPPSVASHQQNGDALHFSRGGDLATQHLQEATEGGRREAEDDDDDDLTSPRSDRTWRG